VPVAESGQFAGRDGNLPTRPSRLAQQVRAEPIVVGQDGFPELLASVAPDYEIADRMTTIPR
jgi:hypothetical protein